MRKKAISHVTYLQRIEQKKPLVDKKKSRLSVQDTLSLL